MNPTPRVIALLNQKGGVGKTSILTNLAVAAALADRRTLVIDLDPQANATRTFLSDDDTGAGVYQVLLGQTPLKDVLRQTGYKNLDLAPADKALAGLERLAAQQEIEPWLLKQQIQAHAGSYELVLIDGPRPWAC